MRNLVKALLLICALVFCVETSYADSRRRGQQRISREQLAEKQARHIAAEMELSPETTAKFVETYTKYQTEIWKVNGAVRQKKMRQKNLTELQTDSLIKSRFDNSQRILDIRKKYYNEYHKFLTAKQISQVYKLEAKVMKKLNARRKYSKKR